MTNEPEEWRRAELEAQSLSARIAAHMIRRPRVRWVLRPLYRVMKWAERQADEALKDGGWR